MTANREFTRLYERWFDAVRRRDTTELDEILSDEWVYTDIFGTVRGKGDYFDLVRRIPDDFSMGLVELEARVRSETAVVTGFYVVKGSLTDGKDLSSQSRFTAAWVSEPGRGWRCLAHQATSVRDES